MADLRIPKQTAYVAMLPPAGIVITKQTTYVVMLPSTSNRRRQIVTI